MYFIMLSTKNLDVLGGRILKKLKHQWGLMFPADIIFLFHSSCSMTKFKCIQHKALNC